MWPFFLCPVAGTIPLWWWHTRTPLLQVPQGPRHQLSVQQQLQPAEVTKSGIYRSSFTESMTSAENHYQMALFITVGHLFCKAILRRALQTSHAFPLPKGLLSPQDSLERADFSHTQMGASVSLTFLNGLSGVAISFSRQIYVLLCSCYFANLSSSGQTNLPSSAEGLTGLAHFP